MDDPDDRAFETFRGVLPPRRIKRLESVLDTRTADLAVVLENLHDSHNLSAVLRSADAFGVKRVDVVDRSGDHPD